MKKHPPGISTLRARELRRNATPAELCMWRLLREEFPEGRWRRQVPVRHYIADFASHRLRIIIELDGGQHSDFGDAARTAAIEDQGYRVIRFWNNEVLKNSEGCLIRLAEVINQPHPHPTATRRSAKSPYPPPIEGEGIL
jgi:very-short-patch-repair endonuclease